VKKKGYTQLNALIPTPMHKGLKKQAAEEERPMAEILEDALTDYFKKVKKKK
jgi:hypothetical protein